MDVTEISILHHIGLVLVVLCILSSLGCSHLVIYFGCFVYLCEVNRYVTMKLQRKLHFEERKQASQRKLLSDSETVRWLNHAVEKIWPICMEKIASQNFLLPIVPWFLDKYKPWTAEKAVVQHLYLGRNPPLFTEMRVLRQSTDGDHLVLELGMNFLSGDDMSATLDVQLKKSLGFGLWTKMHITGMHIEGKVLVGVRFLRQWPYLGRLRICFVEPPYFQMTVKPFISHGLDVTEIPGISGWLDKLLAGAFEQTLVEPNMLVVNVEKFVSTPTESWFTMDEKSLVAVVKVEVVEATDLRPADLNGLADPYVKGQLGLYRFKTKTQKKTLTPKWQEEFKIPIHTWEHPNELFLMVFDQDHIFDDNLGDCSITINNLRGGQRHDKWCTLLNTKMGRLNIAITVEEYDGKEGEHLSSKYTQNDGEEENARSREEAARHESTKLAQTLVDEFEPINVDGQPQTGIWIHRPGTTVSQTWEPRKREGRRPEIEIRREDIDSMNSSAAGLCDSSNDTENASGNRPSPISTIKRSLKKIGSIFQNSSRDVTSPKSENLENEGVGLSPNVNIRSIDDKEIAVKFVADGEISDTASAQKPNKENLCPVKSDVPESPRKGHMRGMTKGFLKQASRSAHGIKHALSRKDSRKSKDDGLESDLSDQMSPSSSMEHPNEVNSIEFSPNALLENVQLVPDNSKNVP